MHLASNVIVGLISNPIGGIALAPEKNWST